MIVFFSNNQARHCILCFAAFWKYA